MPRRGTPSTSRSTPRPWPPASARPGSPALRARSRAADRREYLVRPDRGRRLTPESRAELEHAAAPFRTAPPDVLFVVADGLSAFAPSLHAVPLLTELRPRLEGWKIGPVVVALQSRVALGDEIGEIFNAGIVVMLIGERPGLSSPDSLGLYLTHHPKVGRTDAERNCLSNVRPGGLDSATAAYKLHRLLEDARRLQLSGVELKDESDGPGAALRDRALPSDPASQFLL